jgi:hypothetical protein
MKKQILDDLNSIYSDLDYYKSKKDIIRFLTRINNLINNEKDLIGKILEQMIEKLKNIELEEKKIKELEKIIFGFLLRNKKTYTRRNITKDRTVYEYDDRFIVYINNKKNDIKETIKKDFKDQKIDSITVDNVK